MAPTPGYRLLATSPSNLSKETDSQPLLTEHESSSAEFLVPPNEQSSVTKSSRNVPLVFNIFLTIFNIGLVLYAWHYLNTLPLETSFYPVHKLTYADIAKLRRPSQFVNLEQMYEKMQPLPRTFTAWPMFLAPVDPDRPNEALGNDPKRRRTLVGVISPEDREFRVSNKISTVVQFRAIDYKMEYCQLAVKPPPDATIGERNNLEIYELEDQAPIRAKDLTFANRPPRRRSPLAITNVSNGSEWHLNFSCPTDTLFTFEFACERGSECDVTWWQDKTPPNYGIYLTQSSVKFD